ncbi:MAG TPA: PAS domain-containing protein [Fimbriimonadaceae bacterium]|nr:PAS domain-containing protein [Fimbriimonadaceae bacterium]
MERACQYHGGESRYIFDSLSPREHQILSYATDGLTDQAIANALGISRATVTTYWGRIRTKIGPCGRTELVARYVREENLEAAEQNNLVHHADDDGGVESSVFVRKLAAAAGDLVYVYDVADSRNLYVSVSSDAVTGYSAENLAGLGRHIPDILVHPADRASVAAKKSRLADLSDGGVVEYEYRLVKPNGQIRWLRTRATPFARNANGSIAKVLAIATDVTAERSQIAQLKERIQALSAANEELERRLAEGQRELAGRTRDVEAVSQTLVREVLQPLACCAQTFATTGSDDSPDRSIRLAACFQQVAEVARSAEVLAECCRMLGRAPTVRRVDVGQVAREVWQGLRPKCDLRIGNGCTVDADPDLLRFALRELLDASILATQNLDRPVIAVEPFQSEEGSGLVVWDNRIMARPAAGDGIADPDTNLRQRVVRRLVEESRGSVLSRPRSDAGFETVLLFGTSES